MRSGAWLRQRQQTIKARGVIFTAGALGTNLLLANCKHSGSLPRISNRLGHGVRTNSESVLAATGLGAAGEPRCESEPHHHRAR